MTQTKLPANWRMTTLGGIAREKPNNGIFRKNPEYLTNGSEGLPVVWVEELFRGNSIDTKDSRRVTATKGEVEKYGLKKGDVLFCRSSLKLDGIAFNNVYLGEDNAALFECHLIRISPNLEDVSPVFLNWVLRSPRVRAIAKSKSKTATMTTIDQQSLSSIPIPLPPLAEQRRIAEVLDRTEALRAKRRAALNELDSLTQSVFLDLFGDPRTNTKAWSVKSLKELGKVKTGGTPPGAKPGMFGGSIPFITPGDLESDDPVKRTVTEDGAAEAETVRAGATLVCCIGATIGKMGKATQRSAFNQQLNAVEWANGVDDDYGLGVLRFFKSQIATWASSTTLPILKKSSFEKIGIPVPPIALQREFARQVTAVEKLKTVQLASLVELDVLFATLQHRAFSGEL